MLKAVVFDLDDTLYDQYEYLASAFRESAKYLSARLNFNENYLLDRLLEISRTIGSDSGKIIDALIQSLGENLYEKELADGAVNSFLSYRPAKLETYDGVRNVLESLKAKNFKIGVLTDGRREIQISKLQALSIIHYFDAIVTSDDYGREKRRPAPFTYHLILRKLEVKPQECAFVADNPKKDFITAKKIGIITIRTLTGEYQNLSLVEEYEAEYTINQIQELITKINVINKISLRKYYEEVGSFEEKTSTYESILPSKQFFFKERLKTTLKIVSNFESPFLNIGCGLGVYEEKINLETVSIDISKTFLNKAKKSNKQLIAKKSTSFIQADVAMLPFKEGAFKSVLCSEVIEHLPDPPSAFSEIRRVAKNSCQCVISIPSPYSFAEKENATG